MNANTNEEVSLLSASALVARARRLKNSSDHRKRLGTTMGRDLTRYFAEVEETALAQRLRRAGLHLDDLDLPPAVAGLEEEILAPPDGGNDRNDGFFARRDE